MFLSSGEKEWQQIQIFLLRMFDYLTVTNFKCLYWMKSEKDTAEQISLFLSRFLYHTQLHTTVGRGPLDEGSASRRGLYLTTHDKHKRQTAMHPAGFEREIPASERPQTLALDSLTIGIGGCNRLLPEKSVLTASIEQISWFRRELEPRNSSTCKEM